MTTTPVLAPTTCQAYRGTLVVPCPNPATVRSRAGRPVCKAHR